MDDSVKHARGVPIFAGTGPDKPICGATSESYAPHWGEVTCPDCLAWQERHDRAMKEEN